jgi:tRNA uracil 4-sulfurtransferase
MKTASLKGRAIRAARKDAVADKVERLIVIKYGEIFLKSRPVMKRQITKLRDNLRYGLKASKVRTFFIEPQRDRMFLRVKEDDFNNACEVVRHTFGIQTFSVSWHLRTSSAKRIQSFVRANYRKWIGDGSTFAANVKRSGVQPKGCGYDNSMQLAKLVGDVVERKVDLSSPDVTIFVDVKDDGSYVHTTSDTFKGPGGLPIGTSGKVVCLLSGGIDSAVAAWTMMKRGCQVVFLYADNGSMLKDGKLSLSRVKKVVAALQPWSNGWKLPLFSFDHSSNLITFVNKFERDESIRKLTCLFCKRMMYRLAERLAAQWDAKALVTGETLGEVASQTLFNIAVLDTATCLPVFRPLIGNDKRDNIGMAQSIGTFEASKSAGECCLAVPTHPRTRANMEEMVKAESEMPMKKLISSSEKTLRKVI